MLGDRESALDQVDSVFLAESEARRLFGSANPLGQTLTLVSRGTQTDYRVTGVLADPPKNSHFEATMVARFDPPTYFRDTSHFLTSWGWRSGWDSVSLKSGADAAATKIGRANVCTPATNAQLVCPRPRANTNLTS